MSRRWRPTLAQYRALEAEQIKMLHERQFYFDRCEQLRTYADELAEEKAAMRDRLREVEQHLSDVRALVGLSDVQPCIASLDMLRAQVAARART